MANEKQLDLIDRLKLLDSLGYDPMKFWEITPESTFGIVLNSPTVDAVEVVYCDNCVAHGSCVFELALYCLGYKKPFCCAGKMDGDEDD